MHEYGVGFSLPKWTFYVKSMIEIKCRFSIPHVSMLVMEPTHKAFF